ncbi:hypothetical protein [Chitinophaga deserti]|uniref:hypothetical protein n=1 Tax=Chitinophaga deserti TaxID=2164099 RepID=UPI000D6C1BB1|nr:hypothetical protein [Chitinophaga deserti]
MRKFLLPWRFHIWLAVIFLLSIGLIDNEHLLSWHSFVLLMLFYYIPGTMLLLLQALFYSLTRNYRQSCVFQYLHIAAMAVCVAITIIQPGALITFNPDGHYDFLLTYCLLYGTIIFILNLVIGFVRGTKN